MFIVIGIFVLFYAFTLTTDNIYQQIYVQLLYITGFLLIGMDYIVFNVIDAGNKVRKEIRKLREECHTEATGEPLPKEKHFWDRFLG